ncbi:hypothetical protein HWV07_17890 [Natronomonas salina]|uniref:hypothetical protein n=1 Tax=Natronomonas salina TaxID=1710540 RepID=UPI0015B65D4F|nr:hypothetical protein [Natronomonas salina]QLD90812.1 hypothetical protein HWV07_17890 [Natronomonas salina]
MSLLPWLLDWPPTRAQVAVFLLVSALSVGTIAMMGGVADDPASENVTVEDIDLAVSLNDEASYPEGANGTVQTCFASGTPGDSVSVLGDVILDVPESDGRGRSSERQLRVTVNLTEMSETTAQTETGTGTVHSDVFWLIDDDETLAVGDTVTLHVTVHDERGRVATATDNVVVQGDSRTYDC